MPHLAAQLDRLGSPNILVFGDLILDRYTFGNAERVSPEAPVLILRADAREVRLGGAASVALLLRGLEARVTLAGLVGEDADGHELQQAVVVAGIDGSPIQADRYRPTTTKERFIGRAAGRHPHQMLRVDTETREPISRAMEKVLAAILTEHMSEFDAVLISDYAKGTCTTALLAILIDAARAAQVPVLVDPARVDDYGRYRRATLVKPNRAEAELASGFRIVAPQDALVAGGRLCRQHGFESTLITLDQEGMALVQDDESQELFRTLPRKVCDITGAGDMALAALGLCLASRLALPDSICIANVAAGLEVEKFGVAPVLRAELQQALVQLPFPLGEGQTTEDFKLQNEKCKLQIDAAPCELNPKSEIQNPNSPSKLITASQAASLAQAARAQGRSIVFTNGCFDLLHVGHVTCLYEAAEFGDLLIVALNSDSSVGRLKGPGRPVIDERSRAAMLSALECVDNIVIFAEDTPIDLIRAIRPDVLVKGGTYRPEEIAGRDIVEAGGGRVQVVRHLPGVSTSAIVSAIAGSVGECFTQAHDDPRPPP